MLQKARLILIFCLAVLMVVLTGCEASTVAETTSETAVQATAEVTTITALEAEQMMSDDAVIVDVRNQNEFSQGHIPGAVLLPAPEIGERAESLLPDKNQVVLVYCRSGARSAAAARELVLLGYNRVYDFGGIIDWHGDVVVG